MKFQSKTYGEVSIREIVHIIREIITAQPQHQYILAVGSDSQNTSETRLVKVIVLHKVGTGGIFFWSSMGLKRIMSLREKIMRETEFSLETASAVLQELERLFDEEEFDYTAYPLNLQFHCDVGTTGQSSLMVREVIGYVKNILQETYEVHIKPEAYAASCIADKISKPSFKAS